MSLRRPRRIFRGRSQRAHPAASPRVRGLLLAALVGAGGAGIALSGFTPALFGRSPPLPSALRAPAADVAVIGGDTLRLRGSVIRLAGLVAPQRGEACRIAGVAGCGRAAAAALAALVRDRSVVCALQGADRLGRPFGHCRAAGRDLNRAIVLAGWARSSGAWPALRRAEAEARTAHRGIWGALR